MKQGQKVTNHLLAGFIALSTALLLVGCGGGGGGSSSSGSSSSNTTISGKVTISSTAGGSTTNLKANLQAKPRIMVASKMAHAKGKPFGKAMKASPSSPSGKLAKIINSTVSQAGTLLSGTTVNLYDADHPEWLYPVASATTDSSGQYKMSVLAYSSENGATYTNGSAIPAGNYTLIAIGKDYSNVAATSATYPFQDINTGKSYRNVIAIQAVVKKYSGDVTGNDLTAQSSDAVPQILSIMGKKISNLAINASGEYDLGTLDKNVAIQVTFDMAMHRVSTPTAITLKEAGGATVPGTWKMSADLTVATFYPDSALNGLTNYKLAISSTATANYYGKGLKADVNAVYATSNVADTTPPNAIFVSPEVATGVDITTAIKFAANEPIDINTIVVSSTPNSIGDKPIIKSLGYTNVSGQYDYFYQIVPSDPLQLNTDYAITVSGGKDLAGNSMTSVTANFKTAATSNGVTGTGGSATDQADVKSVVGKWVDSMNASDMTLFSSMLTGDFSYAYVKDSATCNVGSPCIYDNNKDGKLSYDSFTKFIQNWFNDNSKIINWTGDSSGVHLSGDVNGDILVDPSTGTAAFEFNLQYLDSSGGSYNAGANDVTLYLVLKYINGAWYVSSLSDKDITGVVTASNGVITTLSPKGDSLTQGSKTVSFSWTPVTGASSYAVVVMDNSDPTGSTGWVGIIDGQNSSTLDFSSVSDLDASDGKLAVIGGGLNAPFSKELKMQDGGSYTWMVFGFKNLTAATFISGTISPDADLLAYSSGDSFSIQGSVAAALSVTPKTSSGASLVFSDTLYAWDAGSANSITLDITGSSASSAGTVYVYGNNYTEKAFTFDPTTHKATIAIDLFNGYNWIDVTDGVNWWYATTGQTSATYASNYIYTKGGVAYNLLTVDSVAAGTTALSYGTDGYYTVSTGTATTVTLTGKASTAYANVYIYNSAYDSSSQYQYASSTVQADSSGNYSATVDMYTGYNWLSVYDDYGNWTYVDLNNTSGYGASYISPISGVLVNGSGPDTNSVYQVASSTNITVTGSVATSGTGYWYQYNSDFSSYTYGSFTPVSNTFSISVPTNYGYNYIDLYDYNGNWLGLTVYNSLGVTQVGLGVTGVTDSGGPLTADVYGVYNSSNSSVTVSGTATSGNTVDAYVYGGSSYVMYTATAGAGNTFSLSNLTMYNGYNYIDLYDGTNWYYLTVYTSAGATYVSPISNVMVDGVAADAGGTSSDSWGDWNYVTATNVTLTGSGAVDGTGYYYTNSTSGTFSISGGVFSLPLTLDNGWNYIDLYDANSNYYSAYIYTSGGVVVSKIVAFTNPVQDSSVNVSSMTVTGTIDPSFDPSNIVEVDIYDWITGTDQWYSNSLDFQQNYGDLPLTYDSVNHTFSFTGYFVPGNMTQLYVNGNDGVTTHSDTIYVNNSYAVTEYYDKPQAKTSSAMKARARSHRGQVVKKALSRKAD